MGAHRILELDEERISKERPPALLPIQAGTHGDVIVETVDGISRFNVFGKPKVLSPRKVTFMSRVEVMNVTQNILTSGQREERCLFPLASTHPEEVYRYWSYARLAKGNVLVSGIGLGVFVQQVNCKYVLALEPDRNIYDLVFRSFVDFKYINVGMVHGALGEEVKRHSDRKYDFIFLDPVAYTGNPSNALATKRLPEFNRLINASRNILSQNGRVAIKGYGSLIKKYQEECQSMVMYALASDDWASKYVEGLHDPMEEMCIKWARKNWKQVGKRDYKFVNAWARKTAMVVT
jgi:hypothetical protein